MHLPTEKIKVYVKMCEGDLLDAIMAEPDGNLANYLICEQAFECDKNLLELALD
ncbi:MAG: hypothetical protein ACPG5O_04045 [Pseudoalteromonas tetraodonis]